MDSASRERIARTALSYSSADQTEVVVTSESSALTRYTHDAVHQNVDSSDTTVSVRAIIENRAGVARTNALDEASLHAVVQRATEMARFAAKDPDQPPLPNGGPIHPAAGAYIRATADADASRRAEVAKQIFDVAHEFGYWSAGFVATSAHGVSVLNSRGAHASFDGTECGINVKMNADDSTGFAERYSTDVADLDGAACARVAAEKARASAQPEDVAPGSWTVILEPAAFGELFTYIASHFSAQAYDDGWSFLSDRLGNTVLGENVTIRDDYANPLAPGMPFDYEAQPKQRVALIENGVARAVVTDSYYAKRLNRENTGHALPAPNAYGPQATSLVVDPGTESLDELIASTARGLVISRFWYIRTVDRKRAIVTGMTRDGTYLVKNGKLVRGVRNMRFNHSILDALRNARFSNEQRRTGGYSYSCIVPAAKIEGFAFSSGTAF